MSTKAVDQLAMDERVIADSDLEGLLEARAQAKAVASDYAKQATAAHDRVLGALVKLDLKNGEVIRVGRFRIERKDSEPRHVAFDTEAKPRLVIDSGDE